MSFYFSVTHWDEPHDLTCCTPALSKQIDQPDAALPEPHLSHQKTVILCVLIPIGWQQSMITGFCRVAVWWSAAVSVWAWHDPLSPPSEHLHNSSTSPCSDALWESRRCYSKNTDRWKPERGSDLLFCFMFWYLRNEIKTESRKTNNTWKVPLKSYWHQVFTFSYHNKSWKISYWIINPLLAGRNFTFCVYVNVSCFNSSIYVSQKALIHLQE